MREASTGLLVELDAASNVTDLPLEQEAANPAHALYRRKGPNGWFDVTARKFLEDVSALAKGLIAGGLEPGDTVAVMSATSYEPAAAVKAPVPVCCAASAMESSTNCSICGFAKPSAATLGTP